MKTKPLISGLVILSLLLLLYLSSGWLKTLMQFLTLGILLMVYSLFISSLLPKKTPLISRYALLMDDSVGKDELNYTRKVTWAWVILLTWILVAKADALFFQQTWLETPFSNHLDILSFAGMAVLFLGEFYLRKRLFPNKDHGSIGRFVGDISKISLKTIWQFQPQHSPDQKNSV
ncbi:hypothetical protein [Thiomicrorhabdus sp.]|uniref:hypothetical protein n=1 Tax=Thiomicrorhabdus sp. TaxID=2039724 RepID=UPI0035625C29